MKRWPLLVLLVAGCSKPGVEPPPPVEPPPVEPPPVELGPPCTHNLTWVNPTTDIDGNTLAPDELIAATLYATLIPMVPVQYDWIVDVPPYVLLWAINDIEETGIWYYDLTVTNAAGESAPGSASAECVR